MDRGRLLAGDVAHRCAHETKLLALRRRTLARGTLHRADGTDVVRADVEHDLACADGARRRAAHRRSRDAGAAPSTFGPCGSVVRPRHRWRERPGCPALLRRDGAPLDRGGEPCATLPAKVARARWCRSARAFPREPARVARRAPRSSPRRHRSGVRQAPTASSTRTERRAFRGIAAFTGERIRRRRRARAMPARRAPRRCTRCRSRSSTTRVPIRPGPDAVEHRHGPACVREPVDRAPGARADVAAQQARGDDREEQLERDGAETEPERAVVRAERHEGRESRGA